MGKKTQDKKPILTKKIARVQIVKTLEKSLADLKVALGEKKFKRRIKKVSRILSTGLPKSKNKSIKVKKIVSPEQGQSKLSDLNGDGKPKSNFIKEL